MGGDGNIPPSSVAAPVHFPPHMGFCKLGRSVDRFGNKGKRIGYGFVDNQAMDVACGKRGVVMLLKQQGLCKRSQTEPILLEKQSECFVGHRLWIIGIEIASRDEALSGDLFVSQLQLAQSNIGRDSEADMSWRVVAKICTKLLKQIESSFGISENKIGISIYLSFLLRLNFCPMSHRVDRVCGIDSGKNGIEMRLKAARDFIGQVI